MGQSECRPFGAGDQTSDTVKVDSTLLAQPDAKLVPAAGTKPGDAEEQARQQAEAEAKRRLEEQERQRRAEESERQRAEEETRARAEAEARRLREEAELAERAAAERAAAEAEAAEKARRTKAEEEEEAKARTTAERERGEAEKKVATFLKERGFKSISAPRKKLFKVSYPLHAAVEEKNAEMIRLLLKCGADASLKNSAGKTPRELAQTSNTKGSHDAVLAALTQ